jgi:hypothetical protein
LPFAPISRHESASPATGSSSAHKLEQRQLIERAFGDGEDTAAQPPNRTAAPLKPQVA